MTRRMAVNPRGPFLLRWLMQPASAPPRPLQWTAVLRQADQLPGAGKAGGDRLEFICRHPYEEIHWVVAGGESGAGARPVQAEWVRNLRDQCQAQRVAFFFRQWGGRTPKAGGNSLDGR